MCVLLCVFLVWPTKFANTLSFVQNWFDAGKFIENVRNFKFGKIGLQFLFLKIISSHTHAFCSSISMLWDVSKTFSKIVFFLKNLWVSIYFDWSSLFFDQSKLVFKTLSEPLSVSIDRTQYFDQSKIVWEVF